MKNIEHFTRGHAYCNISIGVYKRTSVDAVENKTSTVLMSSMLPRHRLAHALSQDDEDEKLESYFPDRQTYGDYEVEGGRHPGHTGGYAGFQHLPFVCSVDGAVTWAHTGGRRGRGRWLPLRLPLKDIFSPKVQCRIASHACRVFSPVRLVLLRDWQVQHNGDVALLYFARPGLLSGWSPVQWLMNFDINVYLEWPGLVGVDGALGFDEEVAPTERKKIESKSLLGKSKRETIVARGNWWFGRRGDAFVGVVSSTQTKVYVERTSTRAADETTTTAKHTMRGSEAEEQAWLFVVGIASDFFENRGGKTGTRSVESKGAERQAGEGQDGEGQGGVKQEADGQDEKGPGGEEGEDGQDRKGPGGEEGEDGVKQEADGQDGKGPGGEEGEDGVKQEAEGQQTQRQNAVDQDADVQETQRQNAARHDAFCSFQDYCRSFRIDRSKKTFSVLKGGEAILAQRRS
eukprot:scaffold1220_cov259-Pinguiococcus_pyrenoidosus.AAC.99